MPSLILLALVSCADSTGLGGLIELTRQFTQVVLASIAIYFFVGMVVNLAQAQTSFASGDPSGYSHALQQTLSMVILLAVAVGLPALSETLRSWLVCSDGTAASAIQLWKAMAKLAVTIIVSGAGILTTVAVVWSGLGLQVTHMLGIPGGVAGGLRRILILIGGGVLTLSAVMIANSLLALFLE